MVLVRSVYKQRGAKFLLYTKLGKENVNSARGQHSAKFVNEIRTFFGRSHILPDPSQ